MTKDFYKGRKAMVTLETSTFLGWIGEIVDDSEYPVLVIKMQRTEKFRIDALDVVMSEEVKLGEDLEKVLQVFAKTLVAIKRQYPCDHIYKISAFVVGARDMCMEFVAERPFQERMAFAKRVSQIRLVVFPES